MPTYSYRCPECGHQYDKFQKISDATLARCPACGAQGERLISGGAGLLFKGSGFYITDYKRAGDAKSGGDRPEPKKPDASSSGGKADGGGTKSGADT
jgi:putative FmdB family regulatory protein